MCAECVHYSPCNVLAGSLSGEEVGLLGAILTQLGDTLTTIAAHRSLCGK